MNAERQEQGTDKLHSAHGPFVRDDNIWLAEWLNATVEFDHV